MIVVRSRAAGVMLLVILVAGYPATLGAQVRLPAVFSDHMVIQRDKPVSIWGWAGRSEEVTVRLAGREQKARAGGDGKWRVY